MANYKQISYGARGSDVIDLQKKLNQNGYKLDEDGIFGNLTQNAVRDYQQKNNLTANGIVEDNTWGALNKIQTAPENTYAPQSTAGNAKPVVSAPVSTPGNTGYQPSDAVKQAEAMLKAQMANKPGAYQSPWQAQLDEIMGKIMNREPFSYDLNGDALYQQYKGQAMAQGQQAMMDTMGQAAALTGGYGNSYAQTAGQQAYQGHIQQINDRIPELYNLALSKYQMEGQDLKDQASMIGAMEAQDYERHQNQVDSFYRDLSYLTDQYQQEREYDYGKFADGRDFAYGMERDQAADKQWEREFEEAKRRYDQEWEKKYGTTSTGGTGTGGNGSAGGGYDAETAKIQQELRDNGYDVDVDGVWGPETQAAYDDYKNGGKTPDGLPEANGSANAVNFVNSMMTREDARKRGITDSEYNSMVFDKINHANLTEGEIRYVLQHLCGFE